MLTIRRKAPAQEGCRAMAAAHLYRERRRIGFETPQVCLNLGPVGLSPEAVFRAISHHGVVQLPPVPGAIFAGRRRSCDAPPNR